MLFRLYLIEVFLLNSYLFDTQTEQTSSIPETNSPQEDTEDQSESTNKPELDFFMPNSTNEDFIEKKKSIQIIPLNKPKFQLKQLNNSAEYYNQKLSKFSSFGNN
jgi:hypothetical protein